MDNKKNGIPKLRFPGFTGAWEQRKLGEVAMRVTRKNKNLESTLPLTISAQLGLVDQISYFDKRIASSNLTNYILLNRGEFAYNKSYSNGYPFGAVKRLNRYDKGVIPSLYIAFMPNTIFINSDFMEMYFETSLWHKEVSARASEGARNHGLLNISPSDFMDIYMKIPEKIEEQKKIAKFLEDFDSLIALHQRKLEHLQEQKKGLLQKMFPKNGETVPEVRFPGFTDAWEQRKLGDLGKAKSGFGFPESEQGGKEGVPFFKVSDMNLKGNEFEMTTATNYVTHEQISLKKWKPIEEVPAIFFAKVGAAVLLNRKRLCRLPFLLDNNTMAFSFDVQKLDIDFTVSLFSKINLPALAQVGALPSYNTKDVESIKVYIPSLEEQKKIGVYLKKINNLIALHQRKLEHLELMKKGLLQQMFV